MAHIFGAKTGNLTATLRRRPSRRHGIRDAPDEMSCARRLSARILHRFQLFQIILILRVTTMRMNNYWLDI